MELSLERYRHAALQTNRLPSSSSSSATNVIGSSMQNNANTTNSNHGQNASTLPSGLSSIENDKRLQPRLLLNMFPGSNILKNDKMHLQCTLNGW